MIRPASTKPRSRAPDERVSRTRVRTLLLLFLLFAGYFACCLTFRWVPVSVLYLYLGVSLGTIIAYCVDKMNAVEGERRIRESTLHLMALLGGWPGALLAQQLIRHKSSKKSFQDTFLATTLINMSVFLILSSPTSMKTFRDILNSTQILEFSPGPTPGEAPSLPSPRENYGIQISPLPSTRQ